MLPGVTIEARSPSVVGVSVAVSDERGGYRFPALPPGRYEISASLSGFASKKMSDIDLLLGQALKVDIALAVAGVSEAVQVTGESPLIDVKQNAATASITQDLIERIPRGRNFTSVINTAPGTNDESRNGGAQIDGSSGSENRFVVDGMDTTNLRNGTSGKTVFTDFLAEVQVKTSGYAAEYGGSTGGVINAVSKSGSNAYHGSAGTYYRNDAMQSAPRKGWRINPFTDCTANTCAGTPEFVATPDAPFSNWNPLGDLGGPIFQNRAWFYGATSYDRTDTERTTKFRNSPAPYATKTLSTWSDSNYYNGNISTQLTSKIRLRGSAALQRSGNRGTFTNLNVQPDGSFFADGTPTNGFNTATWDTTEEAFKDRWERTGSDSRNDLYAANLDWVITPRFFASVQTGYWATDTANPPDFAGDKIVHSFSGTNCDPLPGGSCPFPETPGNLRQTSGYSDNKSTSRTVQDLYARTHVNTNLTWFKTGWGGEHQFKFGARFERLENKVDAGAQEPTITLFWNNAYAALDGRTVRGTYGYYQVSKGVVSNGDVHSNNWSFWAQDSWTIHRNLTLNAGLRTENENTPSFRDEFPGISFGFGKKLAPRVGFAYDVKGDSKWKAYGSFGKYFDITKLEMPRGSFGADHWIQYFWTLDTLDWTGINCQEGPTGCPGTFIEQNDLPASGERARSAADLVLRPRAEHDRSQHQAGADRRDHARPRSRAGPDDVGRRALRAQVARSHHRGRWRAGAGRRRGLLHRQPRRRRGRTHPAGTGPGSAEGAARLRRPRVPPEQTPVEPLVADWRLHLEPVVRQLRRPGQLGRERPHQPQRRALLRRRCTCCSTRTEIRSPACCRPIGRTTSSCRPPMTCRGGPMSASSRRPPRAGRCPRASTCSATTRPSSTAAATSGACPGRRSSTCSSSMSSDSCAPSGWPST